VTATEAVLIDALGTLVDLEPPWVGLRPLVPEEISDQDLVGAVKAEMGYYREHASEGRDAESLAELRDRCATVLSDQLGHEITADQLVEAIRFSPFPDAQSALEGLRDREIKIICLSNWDVSLGEVLDRCGLMSLLDDVVSSAQAGSSKPSPDPFLLALELAGCEAEQAIHVGDTLEEDVVGAQGVGVRPLLLDRDSSVPDSELPEGLKVISSLEEIEHHLEGD
jgi:putative hydrolase of the HAD superfamily